MVNMWIVKTMYTLPFSCILLCFFLNVFFCLIFVLYNLAFLLSFLDVIWIYTSFAYWNKLHNNRRIFYYHLAKNPRSVNEVPKIKNLIFQLWMHWRSLASCIYYLWTTSAMLGLAPRRAPFCALNNYVHGAKYFPEFFCILIILVSV